MCVCVVGVLMCSWRKCGCLNAWERVGEVAFVCRHMGACAFLIVWVSVDACECVCVGIDDVCVCVCGYFISLSLSVWVGCLCWTCGCGVLDMGPVGIFAYI